MRLFTSAIVIAGVVPEGKGGAAAGVQPVSADMESAAMTERLLDL
jgi:hypothetical protein